MSYITKDNSDAPYKIKTNKLILLTTTPSLARTRNYKYLLNEGLQPERNKKTPSCKNNG